MEVQTNPRSGVPDIPGCDLMSLRFGRCHVDTDLIRHCHGDTDLIRRCHKQLARSTSRPEVLSRMSIDHWLQGLRPVTSMVWARERGLDLRTHQKLDTRSEFRPMVKAATWCPDRARESLTSIKEEEELTEPNRDSTKPYRDKTGTLLGCSSCTVDTSKGLIDVPNKRISLDAGANGVTELSNKRQNCNTPMQWRINPSKTIEEITSGTIESKDRHDAFLEKTRSRLTNNLKPNETMYSTDIECNRNNIYKEDGIPSDTRLQSSVDAYEESMVSGGEGDMTQACPSKDLNDEPDNTIEEAGDSLWKLSGYQLELHPFLLSYPKFRGEDPLSLDNPTLETSLATHGSSQHRVNRLASLTKTSPLISGSGFKARVPPKVGFSLPKAGSDTFPWVAFSGLEIPTKPASDLVVSRTRAKYNSMAVQLDKKKNKSVAKKASPSNSLASHAKLGRSGPQEAGADQLPLVTGKGNSLSKSVLMVDYRPTSTHAEGKEEQQRARMRKALLGVYEYNMSGHRQSKIVLAQRHPKKTSSKENVVEKPRPRRTRRIPHRTVAASPSLIASLWKQVDRGRMLHRCEQHQSGSLSRRALPQAARQGKFPDNVYFNATSYVHSKLPTMRELGSRNMMISDFDLHSWSPEVNLELDGDEDDMDYLGKFKSRDVYFPHCGRSLGVCLPDQELSHNSQPITRAKNREQQHKGHRRMSTTDLSGRSCDRLLHLSPPRDIEKRNEVKATKTLPEVPINQVCQTGAREAVDGQKKPPSQLQADMSMNSTTARQSSSVEEKSVERTSSALSVDCKRDFPIGDSPKVTQRSRNMRTSLSSPERCISFNMMSTNRAKNRKRFGVARVSVFQPVMESSQDVGTSGENRSILTKVAVETSKARDQDGLLAPLKLPRKLGKSRLHGKHISRPSSSRKKQETSSHLPAVPETAPSNQFASASDSQLKEPRSRTRLSPVLPTQPVRDSSPLSLSSNTITSNTTEISFPSALVEADKHRGFPLRRFGSTLASRIQFRHQFTTL